MVFALGDYTRMRRSIIIQMKEYNNQAVRPYVGAVVAAGLRHLHARGELPHEFCLVPAPTRQRSARLRGGDPVTHVCKAAAYGLSMVRGFDVTTVPALRTRSSAADQSHLDAEERWLNMRGSVRLLPRAYQALKGRNVVVVDDVVTTGATLAASVAVLRAGGALVRAGLVLADAR